MFCPLCGARFDVSCGDYPDVAFDVDECNCSVKLHVQWHLNKDGSGWASVVAFKGIALGSPFVGNPDHRLTTSFGSTASPGISIKSPSGGIVIKDCTVVACPPKADPAPETWRDRKPLL